MLTLTNQASSGDLHYTLDGSARTVASPLYRMPLTVALPLTVRVVTFSHDGLLLASPRQRVLDRASLLSVSGNAIPNCLGSDFRLRLQPMPDATSLMPNYSINVFDSCRLYPATPMDGIARIHVDGMRLPRNYQLPHDATLVVSRAHSTPFGELVVHQDRCDGAVLATLPLPDLARSARRFALDVVIPAAHSSHALCLFYTAPIDGDLYVIDRVSLLSHKTTPTAH